MRTFIEDSLLLVYVNQTTKQSINGAFSLKFPSSHNLQCTPGVQTDHAGLGSRGLMSQDETVRTQDSTHLFVVQLSGHVQAPHSTLNYTHFNTLTHINRPRLQLCSDWNKMAK